MIPKGILPENLIDGAFIAGGYAACPALATDMDVWVYVQPEQESLSDARDRILTHLEGNLWPYEAQDENRRREGGDAPTRYPVFSSRVAVVRSPHWSHPVHIIVTSATPAELLEGFDISTHQIAIVHGNVIKGSGWTPITERPRILKDTPSTPGRLEKIAARFGQSLTPQGVR